jgi:HK97 family phage major capsid protein
MLGQQILDVHAVQGRLADLRKRLKAAPDESVKNNILAQMGACTEQLEAHKAGAHFNDNPIPGELNLGALAGVINGEQGHGGRGTEGSLKGILRSAFANATPEEQEQIRETAAYLRGRVVQGANLTPGSDGGLLIPSFVQTAIERNYSQFSPVVDVARLFTTENGAPEVFPVLSDSESAEQLDSAAATGADSTVSGDAPPTALTGPTLHAYKISSKPVFVPRETFTDSDIDLVGEIFGGLLARIIRFENLRYTVGSGTSQAQGFLAACSTLDASGTIDLDEMLDLAYAVPALYRPNGVYMMADGTAKYLRKIKTGLSGDKRTIWTDYNQRENTPATLHGYPVYINNDMQSVATDGSYGGSLSSPVAFGDFKRFVVRQAENNRPYVYRYPVPAKDGQAIILFRRSDSKLLVSEAIAKLAVGSS